MVGRHPSAGFRYAAFGRYDMNIVMWILAGGALGWAAFALLGINQQRGNVVSILIGATGGIIGGLMLAPLMNSSPIVSGDFNIQALFIAAVSAAACLAIASMIENRFGS